MLYKEGLINAPADDMLAILAPFGLPGHIMNEVHKSFDNSDRKELHHFMNNRLSTSLRQWIKLQDEDKQPKTVSDCIHMIERWCEAHSTVDKG